MPNILAIESTGKFCSVALLANGMEYLELDKELNNHSSILHLLIDKICNRANVHTNNLNAVAISAGPGSYTGLRVGSSSAKGICAALSIPLISVPTHFGMLFNKDLLDCTNSNAEILCLTDARRKDVFYSAYKDSVLIRGVGVVSVEDKDWQRDLMGKEFTVLGSGAQKLKETELFKSKYIEGESLSALQILHAAMGFYKRNQFVDIASYEPKYEKEFYSTQKGV